MSHYAVLVIHKEDQDIEELLAPYSEHLEVEPYFKYTVDEAIDYIKEHYVPYNDYLKEYTDRQLIDWFAENKGLLIKQGGLYSTYNPNSKWDWYSIGGRFDGDLDLTDEGIEEAINYPNNPQWFKNMSREEQIEHVKWVNTAPLKYIKWFTPLSEEDKAELKRWWEINIDGDELKDGEEKDEYFFWNLEWFKRRYKDVDTYLRVKEMVTFFAVLTPDGEWHEPGRMGYFACALCEPEDELKWDLEFYDNFIKPNLDSDLICTVVDCHI